MDAITYKLYQLPASPKFSHFVTESMTTVDRLLLLIEAFCKNWTCLTTKTDVG